MSTCPSCAGSVEPHWRACPACGEKLSARSCHHCGAAVEAHWKACVTCGERLGSAPSRAPAAGSFSTETTQPPAPAAPPGSASFSDEATTYREAPAAMESLIAGRYEVREVLGRGGMGVVYRAHDRNLHREVAVKRMVLADQPALLARFRQEARSVAKLQHPNIASVYDFGEDEHGPFLVMEVVEGRTLRAILDEAPTRPEARWWELFQQICAGIEHAHERGVIHRDLKPGNVMVTEDGVAKVLDFGLARGGEEARITQSGAAMGTLDYMPPEQKRDASRADERADVYSLGCLLYELLTGHSPPVNSTASPPAWRELLDECTHPDPDERPQSVLELLDECEDILDPEATGAPTPLVTEVRPPPAPVPEGLARVRTNEAGYEEFALLRDPELRLIWIPGGEVTLTDDHTGRYHDPNRTRVTLSGYFIGRTPVTQAQFARFCAAIGAPFPDPPPGGTAADHPVVNVSWEDARAYCEWAGLHLPTEAQWQLAAAGPDARPYPWGSLEPTSHNGLAHMSGSGSTTASVEAHPRGQGPFGTLDQAGNVWEWCSDLHGPLPGGHVHDHRGAPEGHLRAMRGGSFCDSAEYLLVARRHGLEATSKSGFRGFRAALVP